MNTWHRQDEAGGYFSLTCFGIKIHGNLISTDETNIYIYNYDELSATLPKRSNVIKEVKT